MKQRGFHAVVVFCGGALISSALLGQGQRGISAADARNANRSYNKHDLSGIWTRNGTPGGYGGGGTCRDCGDRGYGNDVPPFTPLGQKVFDAKSRHTDVSW